MLRLVTGAVALALAAGMFQMLPAHATPVPVSTASDPVVAMRADTQAIVTSLAERSGSDDVRYIAGDVFVDGTPECFRCTIGPAALFAASGVRNGDATAVTTAIRVIDKAIAEHQRADGALVPPGASSGDLSIETVMGANIIAETYLILSSRLDAAHQARWKDSLARSADYLIKNGNLAWYTNGNINLANAINMDLVSRITGEPRFKQAAVDALAFTYSPPQARWPGFGLQITRTPTAADGSDGAGYLAESGSGGTGFDPVYTLLQSNMASMWFVLTGDQRALRLTNLLYNQLRPRVRTSDWTIDVGGGTRKTAVGVRYGFTNAAYAVLARKGGRSDLTASLASQLEVTRTCYWYDVLRVNPGVSYSFGIELAPILLAVVDGPPAGSSSSASSSSASPSPTTTASARVSTTSAASKSPSDLTTSRKSTRPAASRKQSEKATKRKAPSSTATAHTTPVQE